MLKEVQQSVRETEDLRANAQVLLWLAFPGNCTEFLLIAFGASILFSKVNDDLNTLISVLESPVFQSILNIQDSLKELKKQVGALSHWSPQILYLQGPSASFNPARGF